LFTGVLYRPHSSAMRVFASCFVLTAALDIDQSASEFLQAGNDKCEQQCHAQGYTCKSCSNTNGASSYGHPSCAMGCYMGRLSNSQADCEKACKSHDGSCDVWTFRATLMSNCGPDSSCPGQNRRGSSVKECLVGCSQAGPYLSENEGLQYGADKQDVKLQNGPNFNIQDTLRVANNFRKTHGKKPMTWQSDKKNCADKVAVCHQAHGESSPDCAKYNCGGASGDFHANDYVDTVKRVIASAKAEGFPDCTGGHCAALLDYNSMVIGYDYTNFFATIRYYGKSATEDMAANVRV